MSDQHEQDVDMAETIALLHRLREIGLIRIKAGSDPNDPIWEKTKMGEYADELLKIEKQEMHACLARMAKQGCRL